MVLSFYQLLVLKLSIIERNELAEPIFEKFKKRLKNAPEMSAKAERKLYTHMLTNIQTDEDSNGLQVRITADRGRKNGFLASRIVNFKDLAQPYIMIRWMVPEKYADKFWQMFYEQKTRVIIQMENEDTDPYEFIPKKPKKTFKYGRYTVKCESMFKDKLIIRRSLTLTYEDEDDDKVAPHKIAFIQYLLWDDFSDEKHIPSVDQFVQFYNYLSYTGDLESHNQESKVPFPYRTHPTYAPILMGKAAILIVIDSILRTIVNTDLKKPCIEKWLIKTCSKMSNLYSVSSPDELLFIYRVLKQRIEDTECYLRKTGLYLENFPETMKKIEPTSRNIRKFFSVTKWCPREKKIKKYLRMKEQELEWEMEQIDEMEEMEEEQEVEQNALLELEPEPELMTKPKKKVQMRPVLPPTWEEENGDPSLPGALN